VARLGLAATALALILSASFAVPAAMSAPVTTTSTSKASLQIFYRSPVLVRPGESVRIPVDAVCIRGGTPCAARVRLTVAGTGSRSAAADAGLEFDISAPAARARAGGRIDYTLSATGGMPGGAPMAASLPGPAGGSLHLYVAPHMATAAVPGVRFGRYQDGRQVLFLPWGSGESSAGLSAGEEAATLGPSSFAVGPDGTIEVADVFHQRIVEFRGGRLIASLRLAMSPQTDIAVGQDGQTFVASDYATGERRTRYTVLDAGGDLEAFRTVPGGILAQIGTDGTSGYARTLPLDAWTPFPTDAGSAAVDTGLPLPTGGQLLRSVVGNSVRLGIASGNGVNGAVELRSSLPLGDLAFAAPDGAGGYVAVVRALTPAGDAYEVLRVARDAGVTAFAVPSHQFAEPLPQAQFRLGSDGSLYQMTTSPDGVRIVRYGMGGTP
jgi:hypothetical protein